MNPDEFLSNFASEFPEVPSETFSLQTDFQESSVWDSLAALTIISMVDEKYEVRLSGTELRKCKTIHDLYQLVCDKK